MTILAGSDILAADLLQEHNADGTHKTAYVVPGTRQVIAGTGLTGGGALTSNVTLTVNQAFTPTWTGAHIFQGAVTTRTILPEAQGDYDLGSDVKPWHSIYASELNSIVFNVETITILAGSLMVSKDAGILAADVSTVATTIDFGQTMTPNDFVILRGLTTGGSPHVEYLKVLTLVSATTYNVTRNLDGGTDAWVQGTPFCVLGNTGNGRIELSAYTTPRISILEQGATYNATTDRVRIGDLNGSYGIVTEKYGFGVGDYSGGDGNYFKYDSDEFVLKAGSGAVTVDADGIEIVAGTTLAKKLTWAYSSGTVVGEVYVEDNDAYNKMFVTAKGSDHNKSVVRIAATLTSDATGAYLELTRDADTSRTDATINGGLNLGAAAAAPAGALELAEITAPGVGAANTARFFARDNGAGKTQLCAIFQSGAIQVMATEP